MRLYKVRTNVSLEINNYSWFRRKVKYVFSAWFTKDVKYIYAKDIDEAKNKYYDIFFKPEENGYNKVSLLHAAYYYDKKSHNFSFDLSFNQDIKRTYESIYVNEAEVIESINEIKNNMTAEDFKNWFNNIEPEYLNEEDTSHEDCDDDLPFI